MRVADRAAESVGGLRHRDQMDVVGHQAVGPYLDPAAIAPVAHQADIGLVVLVGKERAQAAVAPLRHMVREPRSHYARQPWHAASLAWTVLSGKQRIASRAAQPAKQTLHPVK